MPSAWKYPAVAVLLLEKPLEHAGEFFFAERMLGHLVGCHQQEHAVGKALIHGKAARGADLLHTGNLTQAVDQARIESSLRGFGFRVGPVGPRERDVHSDDFVDPEAGIDFENFLQATAEEARADDEHERYGHLRGDDAAPKALAGLRAGLRTSAFAERFTHVAGSRADRGKGT